jgi:hypothetical protein
MAGVGEASSILAVIELSYKIIEFLIDIKDASSDRTKILAELRGACGILQSLAEKAKKSGTSLPNVAGLAVKNGPLMEYKVLLEELIQKLTKGKGLRDVPKRIMFVARKEDIERIMAALERYKSTFLACLQEDTL